MKFLALDIESTGLDLDNDQILELGLIAVDTKLPPSTWKTLHLMVNHPRISGNVYALSLHNRIFNFIKNWKPKKNSNLPVGYKEYYLPENECIVIKPEELYIYFEMFVSSNFDLSTKGKYYSITCAGKNAANFDIPFLKKHFNKFCGTNYSELNDDPNNRESVNFRKRVIDPAVLFTNFIDDDMVADLGLCKERAGLDNFVSHNALEDAWDVVFLICKHIGWNLNNMIDHEFITKYWSQTGINSETPKPWLMNMNDQSLSLLYEHPEVQNPFRRWELVEILDRYTVREEKPKSHFVWNIDELKNFLPIKQVEV